MNDTDAFEVDRLRMKIWDEMDTADESDDVVVYDNGLEAEDFSDDDGVLSASTTEIGGGSIKIHKAK